MTSVIGHIFQLEFDGELSSETWDVEKSMGDAGVMHGFLLIFQLLGIQRQCESDNWLVLCIDIRDC